MRRVFSGLGTSCFCAVLLAVSLCACPAWGIWTTPERVNGVNRGMAEEWSPFLSFDGESLYFSRVSSPSTYYGQMYRATRDGVTGAFTSVEQLSGLNENDRHVFSPWVSADNLRMYYCVQAEAGWGLRFAERASETASWTPGTSIGELNGLGSRVGWPKLTEDELSIVFSVRGHWQGKGGSDLWIATRPDTDSPFTSQRILAEINTGSHDISPYISPNGLDIYFMSDRNGPGQLFHASRLSRSDIFGSPEHLEAFDVINGSSHFPALSSDGRELYFMHASGGRGTRDIYVSYVPEPVTLVMLGVGGLLMRRRRG